MLSLTSLLWLLAGAPAAKAQAAAATKATAPEDGKASLAFVALCPEPGLEQAAAALEVAVAADVRATGAYRLLTPPEARRLPTAAGKDACALNREAAAIATALGARYVLRGAVTRLNAEVMLSLQLDNASEGGALLGLGVAHGAAAAADLQKVATASVAALFGASASAAAPYPFAAYSEALLGLARLVGNLEYSAVLSEIDRLERTPPNAPPGQDIREVLAFYRASTCFGLRRLDCATHGARSYLDRYPKGIFAPTVRNLLTQIEDEELQREAKRPGLARRIAEIADRARVPTADGAPSLDERQVTQLEGYAYFEALETQQAAMRFGRWLDLARDDDEWFQAAEMLVIALERVGRFDDARTVLARAERKDARTYRLRSMHLTLQRLPR